MLKFYGNEPPRRIDQIKIGGKCPHCGDGSRFTKHTSCRSVPRTDEAEEVIIGYACDACLKSIPIRWEVNGWQSDIPVGEKPELILRSQEDYNFDHVPEAVEKEIQEALDCLSVNAYHGFAALCRRAVQEICSDLGADGISKVQKQINEMLEMTGLGEEGEKLAKQIMLTGHDGAHPELPEVDENRASVLLSLLKDLTYELYTRPGKVEEAAELRQDAIQREKQ
jgi:hypothetical protein